MAGTARKRKLLNQSEQKSMNLRSCKWAHWRRARFYRLRLSQKGTMQRGNSKRPSSPIAFIGDRRAAMWVRPLNACPTGSGEKPSMRDDGDAKAVREVRGMDAVHDTSSRLTYSEYA